MNRYILGLLVFCSFSVLSQNLPSSLNCDKKLSVTGTLINKFKVIATMAEQSYAINCRALESGMSFNMTDIKMQNSELHDEARNAVQEVFGAMAHYFSVFWQTQYDLKTNKGKQSIEMYDYAYTKDPFTNQISLSLGGITPEGSIFSQSDSNNCDATCRDSIEQLTQILNHSTNPLDQIMLDKTKISVGAINLAWTNFLDEARPQTFIDIAVNSALYRRMNKGVVDEYFTLPPSYQLFFLHPSVIIERIPDALDGDQVSEAVALEVIGINYWNGAKMCFGYPCGASFIVTYKDRAEVDDKGWGVMFHINNTFSLGYNKYGAEDGIFLSVDLFELFKDKKSDYDEWKSTLD